MTRPLRRAMRGATPSAAAALLLAAGGCGGRAAFVEPPGRGAVEARGRYTVGFEASTFVPCGAAHGWWVASLDSVPAVREFLATRQAPNPRAWVTVYVRWRGVLSDSGSYGNVGAFARQLEPRAVLTLRDTTAVDCR